MKNLETIRAEFKEGKIGAGEAISGIAMVGIAVAIVAIFTLIALTLTNTSVNKTVLNDVVGHASTSTIAIGNDVADLEAALQEIADSTDTIAPTATIKRSLNLKNGKVYINDGAATIFSSDLCEAFAKSDVVKTATSG